MSDLLVESSIKLLFNLKSNTIGIQRRNHKLINDLWFIREDLDL